MNDQEWIQQKLKKERRTMKRQQLLRRLRKVKRARQEGHTLRDSVPKEMKLSL